MSKASRRTGSGVQDRAERLQPWIGALLTALVHLLLLLLVLLAPPITMTDPQGGTAGSRMEVTFIDESLRVPPPAHTPTARKAPPRKPRKAAPAARRVQTTPVTQADDPDRLHVVDISDSPTTSLTTEPQPPGEPASAPPDVPTVKRPAHVWGQPPGMLPQDLAPVNAGRARSPAVHRGRRNNDASSGTGLEVGGYQVYYDLLNETRLRAWRDQGMTELFLPLPGTRRLMVCPLEVALRRDSGECRLVEPDSPELEVIGDARDVVIMQRIYRLGEVLWRGPGAYR